MKLLGNFFLLILFLLTNLYSNDYGIKLSSSKKSIYPNQPFILSVNFNYKIDLKVNNIKIYNPGFENLKILNKTKLKQNLKDNTVFCSFEYLLQTIDHQDVQIQPFILEVYKKKKVRIYSNSLTIKSIVLPQDIEFIGDYNISTKVRKVNSALVYFDIITEGISYTKLPNSRYKLKIPNVSVFEDKLELDCKEEFNKFYCKKHASYSLIAQQNYEIPSIELKYVDIKTGKVVTKRTPVEHIVVRRLLDTKKNVLKKQSVEIKSKNLKDESMLTNSSLFYLYLSLGFLVILGSILIAILAYKKSIRAAKEKIILDIESVKSNEELYSLLLAYFGLDDQLDIKILEIKEKTKELVKNKKNLIDFINKKQIYSLFYTKKYDEINKVKTLTLEDKIKMYTETKQYKVNREKLININEEKNIIKPTPKIKDIPPFDFKVLVPHLLVFIQSLSLLSIIPLFIIFFNLVLIYYTEYIVPIIEFIVLHTYIISTEEEATKFVNEISRIGLITQLWISLKMNHLSIFEKFTVVAIFLFPIITLWINIKYNFKIINMKFIFKVILGVSGLFGMLMLFTLGIMYNYDYDGWLSFFVVMAFVLIYIELFDKQVTLQAKNTHLFTAIEDLNDSQKKQLKFIDYWFLPMVVCLYIILYFTILDWSGGAIVFFIITPFLFVSFISTLLQRYFIYQVPLHYLFTYKELKESIPSLIFLLYISLHIDFVKF